MVWSCAIHGFAIYDKERASGASDISGREGQKGEWGKWQKGDFKHMNKWMRNNTLITLFSIPSYRW